MMGLQCSFRILCSSAHSTLRSPSAGYRIAALRNRLTAALKLFARLLSRKLIRRWTHLAPTFVSCRLDYCNSLLCGVSGGHIHKLQSIQTRMRSKASSPALDDVIISRMCYSCSCTGFPATSGMQSRVPDATVVVWSGTGVLSWWHRPCRGQWPPSSAISNRQDMCRSTYTQYLWPQELRCCRSAGSEGERGRGREGEEGGSWKIYRLTTGYLLRAIQTEIENISVQELLTTAHPDYLISLLTYKQANPADVKRTDVAAVLSFDNGQTSYSIKLHRKEILEKWQLALHNCHWYWHR